MSLEQHQHNIKIMFRQLYVYILFCYNLYTFQMSPKTTTTGEKRKGDTGKKGKEDKLGEIIEGCIIKP